MKQSLFTKLFSLLLLCLVAFAPRVNGQETTSNSNRHMLWKVSKEEGLQSYLVGSIHLMKPEVYPLDEVYQKAFKESDIVVFELNFDSLKVKSVPLIRRLGFYLRGKTVKSALSSDTYALLKSTLDSLGLPVTRFGRMEPWLLSITLPVIQIRKAGYTGKSGIDKHFFRKAKKAGKKIVGLETAAYQFNLFDDLSPELQEKYLKYSLEDVDRTVKMVDEMVAAWKSGNAEKLKQIIQSEMEEDMPTLYQMLLVERNQNWIPKIEKLFIGEEVSIIIVGAGHMVGEMGVVSLLEKQGYKVEQL